MPVMLVSPAKLSCSQCCQCFAGSGVRLEEHLTFKKYPLGKQWQEALTTKYNDHFLIIKTSNQNDVTTDQASRKSITGLVTPAEARCQGVGNGISAQDRKVGWVYSEASFSSHVCGFYFQNASELQILETWLEK